MSVCVVCVCMFVCVLSVWHYENAADFVWTVVIVSIHSITHT